MKGGGGAPVRTSATTIRQLIMEAKSPSQALHTFLHWASSSTSTTITATTITCLRCLLHHLPPRESFLLTLIRGLSRSRLAPLSVKVLDFVPGTPSLKVLNSVLDALVKHDIDMARRFYRDRMMRLGDQYTLAILMKGLCLTNRIADAFKLLHLFKSAPTAAVKPNAVVYNTLLHALCRNGNVGRARSLMGEMQEPNAVTFNLMISAYAKDGNLVHSLVMLDKCFTLGFLPNVVSITKVLDLLCNAGRVDEAVEVLDRFESKGGAVDVLAYNTLLKGFCKLGKLKVGHRFLKEMERKGFLPNVDTYNILISGFCDHVMLDSALEMFNHMKMDCIAWNFVTFDALIRGLFSGGRIEDGFKVLEQMEEMKGGCGGRVSPYNSVIYGLYKKQRWDEALDFLMKMEMLFPRAVDRTLKILGFCEEGSMENAKRVYDQMKGEGGIPSVIVYDCLVCGFCQQGRGREAVEVMNEMVGQGYYPIASTLNMVVSRLCSKGKEESAMKLIEGMMERGCMADTGTYFPVIKALCGSMGNFQKAVRVLLHMVERKVIPDHLIWKALLLRLNEEALWFDRKGLVHVVPLIERIVQT